QVLLQEKSATSSGGGDLKHLRKRKAVIELLLKKLRRQQAHLLVRAAQDGEWTAPSLESDLGRWVSRGTELGMIVDGRTLRFTAVVTQEKASELFGRRMKNLQVRLHGLSERVLSASDMTVIPFQSHKLPSAALGWMGGGDIPVEMGREKGLLAMEPFFTVHVALHPEPGQASALLHGRSGKLRASLPPIPLLWQGERMVRQFFQKRYQL
ncbi:MAG: hypothetical protein HQL53_10825, partial [Magnetococcales bacterium]|nr:hypothetical protein [Magnetococcales bacterium]